MSERICLLVDDEPAIRNLLKIVLEVAGFKSLEAESARQALRIVRDLGGALDLVVTDIVIAGDMTGIDLVNAIRDSFPSIRLIVMSGSDFQHQGVQVRNFEFIPKPFHVDTMLRAVQRIPAEA